MEAMDQCLAQGRLQEAIDQAQNSLRRQPSAHSLRAGLVELLCLAGELERADQQLASLARSNPDWIPGAANLRQLLRAQQARLALREGQLAEEVVATPGPALEALLTLHGHLSRRELDAAEAAATALETAREPCRFQLAQAQGEIRDCDDTLNGYLEGLGTDGRYYLWQWSELSSLRFHPPESPLELAWRRADLELSDGRAGEAFIPLVYATSATDSQKLGRETDWQELKPALVTGVGLKLCLVGENAVPLDGSHPLVRCPVAEVADAT